MSYSNNSWELIRIGMLYFDIDCRLIMWLYAKFLCQIVTNMIIWFLNLDIVIAFYILGTIWNKFITNILMNYKIMVCVMLMEVDKYRLITLYIYFWIIMETIK